MKKHLLRLQEKICAEAWEKYKNTHTMREMAEVFGVSTSTFYNRVNAGLDKIYTDDRMGVEQ